jgi:hypothetical protein
MLYVLSTLSMFVALGFLLCGAIVVPHDQKPWSKALLIVLALLVGWRAASLHGATGEIADVGFAGLLLLLRRPLWRWMLRHLSRDDEPQPQHGYPFWTP